MPKKKAKYLKNDQKKTYMIEKFFESSLWSARFMAILAVVFGIVSSLLLFILASLDVIKAVKITIQGYTGAAAQAGFQQLVLAKIIGAVDFYLIAVVLLIFSFGVYELFISKVDAAKGSEASRILEINSLDDLKDKISKVIIMVLVVTFFKKVLTMKFSGPLEMLYLALGILALSGGLYLLHGKKH